MDVNAVMTSYNGREIVTDEMEEENLRDNLIIIKESESASLSNECVVLNHPVTYDVVTHASTSSWLASTTPKTPTFDDHASSSEASAAFQVDGSSHLDYVSQRALNAESAIAPIAATILEQQDNSSLSSEPILFETTSNLTLTGEQPEVLPHRQLVTFAEYQNLMQTVAHSSPTDLVPAPQPLFKVKDVVAVEARVGRGMNKHGGVAFVMKVRRIEGRNKNVLYNDGRIWSCASSR